MEDELRYRDLWNLFKSILVGFFIGLSVIMPGISGPTIAISMKLYDKIMYAIANIFKKSKLCFCFLLPILLGIITGVLIGYVLVKHLLSIFFFPTICFFAGLMLGTYPIIYSEIRNTSLNRCSIFLAILGLIIPLLFSILSMLQVNIHNLEHLTFGHYLFFLIIGMIIALTQIVPGLSATAFLLSIGYFTVLLEGISLSSFFNLKVLLVYVMLFLGFIIGLLFFSNLINKILSQRRKLFFFLVCGLSISSIVSIFISHDCLSIYQQWSSTVLLTKNIALGIIFIIIGFIITYLLYLQAPNDATKSALKW